jgi:hypothetical protein
MGSKNGFTRLWARRGTRQRQPKDRRYDGAFAFGASARPGTLAPALSCPPSMPRPCRAISMSSPAMSRPVPVTSELSASTRSWIGAEVVKVVCRTANQRQLSDHLDLNGEENAIWIALPATCEEGTLYQWAVVREVRFNKHIKMASQDRDHA